MHNPVMLPEVMHALGEPERGLFVDATFGAGGYTRAILAGGDTRVLGIDRDPGVQRFVEPMVKAYPKRFIFAQSAFSRLDEVLAQMNVQTVDGVVMDVGVSSMQIDQDARGFSFQKDGPLDMRMSGQGVSAADVVNALDAEALASILFVYGEERQSRRIAAAIVEARRSAPITSTTALSDLIIRTIGEQKHKKSHAATKTFQALRIYVNDELGELSRALHAAEKVLAEGGRLVVVSFHSLEDRLVKSFLAHRSGRGVTTSRHQPLVDTGPQPSLRLMFNGSRKAGEAELSENPRARSARLRAALRTGAPAMAPLVDSYPKPDAPELMEIAQ